MSFREAFSLDEDVVQYFVVHLLNFGESRAGDGLCEVHHTLKNISGGEAFVE